MAARQIGRCSQEVAEDLVSDAVVVALERGEDSEIESDAEKLRSWIIGIIHKLALRQLRTRSRSVTTVALTDAELPLTGNCGDNSAVDDALEVLPEITRAVARDWLDGHSKDQICRRQRLHRNTVAYHIRCTMRMLRAEFPDRESLDCSLATFTSCSKVSIYRKPQGVWLPWRDQHPPERAFARNRKRGGRRG